MSVIPSQHDIHLPSPTRLTTFSFFFFFLPFLSPPPSLCWRACSRISSEQWLATETPPVVHQLSIDFSRYTSYLFVSGLWEGGRYVFLHISPCQTHIWHVHNKNMRSCGVVMTSYESGETKRCKTKVGRSKGLECELRKQNVSDTWIQPEMLLVFQV